MSVLPNCPECNVTWEGDEIPEGLIEGNPGHYTQAEAEKAAEHYGWTPRNKLKFGINYVSIEYPYDHPSHYDGVSEYKCLVCGIRLGRWSGKILKEDEYDALSVRA